MNKLFITVSVFLNALLLTTAYYFFFYKPVHSAIDNHSISIDEIIQMSGEREVYFIDIRNPGLSVFKKQLEGAFNIQVSEINDFTEIKDRLELDNKQVEEALFILFCNAGERAQYEAIRLGRPNLKFLDRGILSLGYKENISVIPPEANFPYRFNDQFKIEISEVLELKKSGKARFIDARWNPDNIFPFAYDFKLDWYSDEEYNERLKVILDWKKYNIVFIAEDTGDYQHRSKLLIHRLITDHGFELEQFHILFQKSRDFYFALKEENIIKEY